MNIPLLHDSSQERKSPLEHDRQHEGLSIVVATCDHKGAPVKLVHYIDRQKVHEAIMDWNTAYSIASQLIRAADISR